MPTTIQWVLVVLPCIRGVRNGPPPNEKKEMMVCPTDIENISMGMSLSLGAVTYGTWRKNFEGPVHGAVGVGPRHS